MNKKQPINSNQLSFSIGRPLAVLLEEVQNLSSDTNLKQAAEQMLEALETFETANKPGVSKSARTSQAIYEILTK
ncbi:hypothetical protein [Calothrix sp. CCY 0018]|uniref:hypothetical protein n=1 Tax=Calothrix sp. CCY 0018 TaxID=3103864 RepID=UPI0039C752E0